MKNKIALLLVCFFAAGSMLAANVTEIVNENFENLESSKVFSNPRVRINPKVAKVATGGDAIDGKASLLVEGKVQGTPVIEVLDLKNGAVYLYKFKTKQPLLLERISSGAVYLADEKGHSGGYIGKDSKHVPVIHLLPRVKNIPLTLKEGFTVPDNGKKYRLRITANKGAKYSIDNLEVWEIIPDETNSYLFSGMHNNHDLFFDKTFPGMYCSPTHPSFLEPNSPILDMPKEKFFPFVDKWGQYKYSEWPNKIKSDEDLQTARVKEKEFYEKHPLSIELDEYNALKGSCGDFKPTGRFCVDKKEGKWIFRAPNGNIFWAFGINSVGMFSSTVITGREHFFENLNEEGNKRYIRKVTSKIRGYPEDARPYVLSTHERIMYEKYGYKNFAEYAADFWKVTDWRIKNWGFNSYANWASKFILEKTRQPFIAGVDFIKHSTISRKALLEPDTSVRKMFRVLPDTFHPKFEPIVKEGMKSIEKLMKSKLCIGVYSDNEIPWEGKDGYTAEAILTCPEKQPAKIGFKDFLEKRYGGVEKLNQAWESKYENWNSFLAERKFVPSTESGKKDLLDFDYVYHERYFKTCRDAIKEIDPNVLYLGARFAWRNHAAVEAAVKYCDVVSYNLYVYSMDEFNMPALIKDKPIIVGEFSISRSDYGHFWKGPRQAANSEDQIALINYYMKSILKHPNFVGTAWFTYGDQPTAARTDGENASFGMMDICDTPHYDMVEAMQKISRELYNIRFGKEK